jgi:hypothetical protein
MICSQRVTFSIVWCYDQVLNVPPWVTLKEKHIYIHHMYCGGEMVKMDCARIEVVGLNTTIAHMHICMTCDLDDGHHRLVHKTNQMC